MAVRSSIEWTQSTWNPITGCTKISPGCKNCYAERMAKRLQAMGQPNYVSGFKLSLHKQSLCLPLSWKKPQTIFVNSMSDLFHEEVPDRFIFKVFKVMGEASWHTFQVLTNRADRLRGLGHVLPWAPNIWMGVSLDNKDYVGRVDGLRETGAFMKFISFEPLIGPIYEMNLSGIDWAIVGGESGPRARPILKDWVTFIRDRCLAADVPFFFKQWGGTNKKKSGRILEGRVWDEMPRKSLNYEYV